MKMHRRLAEYILARIASGEYPVGMKVPSVRRLAAKFGMPYSTVYGQLKLLIQAGILKSLPGRGIFVSDSSLFPGYAGERRIAAFIEPVVVGQQTSISYVALLEFQRQAIAAGFEVKICPVFYTELTNEIFREGAAGCCGAALFKEYDAKLFSFDGRLPTVATLMRHSYGGRISLVNIDEYQIAELAAAYFRYHGFRKLAIVSGAPPVYRRRAEVMRSLWLDESGECRIHAFPESALKFSRDTGYFFTSDSLLRISHVHYREEFNRLLSQDFVVLGVDGKRRLNPDWPVFSTIAADWREIGGCMFAELKRLIDSPQALRRSVSVGGQLWTESPEAGPILPDGFASTRADLYDGEIHYELDRAHRHL